MYLWFADYCLNLAHTRFTWFLFIIVKPSTITVVVLLFFSISQHHCALQILFISEFQIGTASYSVIPRPACARQFLLPVTNTSLMDCLQLHALGNTSLPFSYDATLRGCYTIVPELPADLICSPEDGVIAVIYLYNNESTPTVNPTKLTMTGTKMYTIYGMTDGVSIYCLTAALFWIWSW